MQKVGFQTKIVLALEIKYTHPRITVNICIILKTSKFFSFFGVLSVNESWVAKKTIN